MRDVHVRPALMAAVFGFLLLPVSGHAAPAPAAPPTPPVFIRTPPPAPPAPPPELRNATPAAAHFALADFVVEGAARPSQTDAMITAMTAEMARDPNMAAMDQAYPGLLDVFGDVLRPIMLDEVKAIAPLYRADLAQLYANWLTVREAEQVTAFQRSAAMTRFRDMTIAQLSFDRTARDVARQEDISAQSFASDLALGGVRAMGTLSKPEQAEILAFFASPLGQKLSAINPDKLTVDTRWNNYVTPEGEARIKAAMNAAIISHIGKTDPRVAKQINDAMSLQGQK